MMRKIVILFILVFVTTGMFALKVMSLSGEGSTLKEGEKLYLYAGSNYPSDSTYVKDGKFRFSLKGMQARECSLVRGNDEKQANMLVYLDNCDTYIKIGAGTYESFHNTFMEAEVLGNPTHVKVQEVNDLIFRNTDHTKDPMQSPEFVAKLKEACSRADMSSAYILGKYCSIASGLGFMSDVKRCYENLSDDVKSSVPGENLREGVEKYVSLSVGFEAKDFTLDNVDGKAIGMKQYLKGKKLVLLDFWASWCGPCRKEGENIKAIYQDFHDQGFDVLGISLDSKKEAWLKGIQEEGYKWEQVSDLLGFKSPVCKAYDVNGIPALFLLDGDGKVIGKNLRGDDLRKKVAEYLNR